MRLSRREQVKSLLLPRRATGVGTPSTPSAHRSITERVRRAAAATRVLTRPGWLVFHIVAWTLTAGLVALGRWQLGVSDAKHFDFFNFQYAVQWWLFAAFGLFVWIRVMQHRLNPPLPAPASGGLVLASKNALATRQGATLLVAPGTADSDNPVVYRGYVIPQSSRVPVRSHGDTVHDAYNEYLWQLAVADGKTPDVFPRPVAPADGPGEEEDDQGRPARELQ